MSGESDEMQRASANTGKVPSQEDREQTDSPKEKIVLEGDSPGELIASFTQISSLFRGPLPPPSILREYDEVVPGSAEKIITRFETQSDHRISLEKTVVSGDVYRAWAGLVIGGMLAFTCIIGGIFLVYTGHDTAGATIATASVAALAGVFVYGTVSRRNERRERSEAIEEKSNQPATSG